MKWKTITIRLCTKHPLEQLWGIFVPLSIVLFFATHSPPTTHHRNWQTSTERADRCQNFIIIGHLLHASAGTRVAGIQSSTFVVWGACISTRFRFGGGLPSSSWAYIAWQLEKKKKTQQVVVQCPPFHFPFPIPPNVLRIISARSGVESDKNILWNWVAFHRNGYKLAENHFKLRFISSAAKVVLDLFEHLRGSTLSLSLLLSALLWVIEQRFPDFSRDKIKR